MNTIKPVKLRHIKGDVSAEAFNRLVDCINAMSDRLYTLESAGDQQDDPRRTHTSDNRQAKPI